MLFYMTKVGAEVAKVDGMIGALVAGLAEAHLDDKVNVVVTSTPGFSGVRPGLNLSNHSKILDHFECTIHKYELHKNGLAF